MTVPPWIALALLGAWVFIMFWATNLAAFHQWRTTDPLDRHVPVDAPDDEPSARDERSRTSSSEAVTPADD